jgi:hypothetical protein
MSRVTSLTDTTLTEPNRPTQGYSQHSCRARSHGY